MNKLLTTITLLCFSVAANADIYFCETLRTMSLSANGEFNSDISRFDFVVDTEKGVRVETSENYLGSCSTIPVGGGINCDYRRNHVLGRIYINTIDPDFSFTFTATTSSHVNSSAGTCTKA